MVVEDLFVGQVPHGLFVRCSEPTGDLIEYTRQMANNVGHSLGRFNKAGCEI
jgi:hypothetical protein